ncbi:MAG TPA: molybdopterin-binding protein [Chloroflexaceae bacterium]|nr:molybdopterin-binding protein [Chloroflexaceae bacterium]
MRTGITYEEALATILAAVRPLGPETLPIAEAAGRALAADLATPSGVVAAGRQLRPGELALLAAHGVSELRVVRRPRVAVVAAGDELLPPGAPPTPGKIYDSDSAMLAALIRRDGGLPLPVGIAHDSVASLRIRLAAAIAGGAELILTTAGSHHGERDIVRGLLAGEGRLEFWGVAMEPDRPLLFGALAGVPVIGLPGEPAEALVCAELFARPAILRLAGRADVVRPTLRAALATPAAQHARRHYVRGTVRPSGAGYSVSLDEAGGLAAPAEANALVVIPPGQGELPAGSPVEVLLLEGAPAARG